jgi:5-aminolevulinate synthase
MESLLHQSKHLCPFLKKTSPSTLRSLSTATRPSPGGGTMSNLQTIARRCPVMSKALAVQSARMGGNRAFSNTAGLGKAGVTAARVYAGSYISKEEKKIGKANLHTSGIKGASVDAGVRVNGNSGNGMFAFCHLCMRRRHCDGR